MENLREVRARTGTGRRWTRWSVRAAAVAGLAAGAAVSTPVASGATEPHTGCTPVSVGGSSGWCGLYPGDAVSNVQDLGSVAVSSDGLTLLVQTQTVATGAAPNTSFACLVSTPANQITHRLQATHCAKAGGVWLPFDNGSLTVDLTHYPQFLNQTFTIQVAANGNAGNPNGDSFYNDVSVSTVTAGPPA